MDPSGTQGIASRPDTVGVRDGQQRCQKPGCNLVFAFWDNHMWCTNCRRCSRAEMCAFCADWSDEDWDRFDHRRTGASRRASRERRLLRESSPTFPSSQRARSAPAHDLSQMSTSDEISYLKSCIESLAVRQEASDSHLTTSSRDVRHLDRDVVPPGTLARARDQDRDQDRDRDRDRGRDPTRAATYSRSFVISPRASHHTSRVDDKQDPPEDSAKGYDPQDAFLSCTGPNIWDSATESTDQAGPREDQASPYLHAATRHHTDDTRHRDYAIDSHSRTDDSRHRDYATDRRPSAYVTASPRQQVPRDPPMDTRQPPRDYPSEAYSLSAATLEARKEDALGYHPPTETRSHREDPTRDWSPIRYRIPRVDRDQGYHRYPYQRSPSPARSPRPRSPTIHWPARDRSPAHRDVHPGYYDRTWDASRQFYARTMEDRQWDDTHREALRQRRLAQRAKDDADVNRRREEDLRQRRPPLDQESMTPRKRATSSGVPTSTPSPPAKQARDSTSPTTKPAAQSSPDGSPGTRARATSPHVHDQSSSGSSGKGDRSPRQSSSRDSSPAVAYDTADESATEPAEDGGQLTYAERIDHIRAAWNGTCDMAPPIEEAPGFDVLMGAHASTPKVPPILPWHQERSRAIKRHQDVLNGTGTPPKPPLDSTAFFHKPKFTDVPYRIIGDSATDSVRLPDNFPVIQWKASGKGAKKTPKPHLDVSYNMTRDLESQMRRSLRLASYADWFYGTARNMLENPEKDKDGEPKDPDLPAISALLLSGNKATRQNHAVQQYLLDNWILMRRDAHLTSLIRDVPSANVQALRRHDLGDPDYLFGQAEVTEAKSALDEHQRTRLLTQAVRNTGNSGSKPKNHGGQQSGHQGSRQDNRGHQGRQQGNQQGNRQRQQGNRQSPRNSPKDNQQQRKPYGRGKPNYKNGGGKGSKDPK